MFLTHLPNRVPTKEYWYVFDRYFTQDILTISIIKEIYLTVYTHLYI